MPKTIATSDSGGYKWIWNVHESLKEQGLDFVIVHEVRVATTGYVLLNTEIRVNAITALGSKMGTAISEHLLKTNKAFYMTPGSKSGWGLAQGEKSDPTGRYVQDEDDTNIYRWKPGA